MLVLFCPSLLYVDGNELIETTATVPESQVQQEIGRLPTKLLTALMLS